MSLTDREISARMDLLRSEAERLTDRLTAIRREMRDLERGLRMLANEPHADRNRSPRHVAGLPIDVPTANALDLVRMAMRGGEIWTASDLVFTTKLKLSTIRRLLAGFPEVFERVDRGFYRLR